MYYRPDQKSVCADVIPYFENGTFYLFYLKDYRDLKNKGEGCDWHLVTTKDLVHYEEKGPVILRGTKEEQDLYVYTGSIIKKEDTYYIFYTGHNPYFENGHQGVQKILLATSKDLIHWTKQKDFVLKPIDVIYEINDFRDPFVYFNEEKQVYEMIFTTRYKNKPIVHFKGCLLKAMSKDLLHWEFEEKPLYDPDSFYAHECPDLFKMGDWWYLIFSEFTDRFVTTYRMSKSPYGPWICPKNNTFDGHAYYAAKSVSDGSRRILFGWNPIKEDENDDHKYWQWGGNIIPHEIYQDENGELLVRCPHEVLEQFDKELPLDKKAIQGCISIEQNRILLKGEEKRSIVSLGELNSNCLISLDFMVNDDKGDFGIYLNENENFEYYYLARFDAQFNRLSLDKWPRYDRTKYLHVDSERPSSVSLKQINHVDVIVQDSVLEVYVNGKVAMSERMFEKGKTFGLYASNVDVEFKNIEYKTIKV